MDCTVSMYFFLDPIMSATGNEPPTYGMPYPQIFVADDDTKTFQFDSSLPSLPVPPLQHTCSKYLESGKLVQDGPISLQIFYFHSGRKKKYNMLIIPALIQLLRQIRTILLIHQLKKIFPH